MHAIGSAVNQAYALLVPVHDEVGNLMTLSVECTSIIVVLVTDAGECSDTFHVDVGRQLGIGIVALALVDEECEPVQFLLVTQRIITVIQCNELRVGVVADNIVVAVGTQTRRCVIFVILAVLSFSIGILGRTLGSTIAIEVAILINDSGSEGQGCYIGIGA